MTRALVVVDVQPTFCEGGELPVNGGNDVAAAIARHLAAHRDDYALVATTQDWHVNPGTHFSATPDYRDSWPPHGLAGSANAELHPALAGLGAEVTVRKGHHRAAYSGFDGVDDAGRGLAALLRAAGVEALDVVGLATDYCVAATARDAVAAGLRTRVLVDLSAAVAPDRLAQTLRTLRRDGVIVVSG